MLRLLYILVGSSGLPIKAALNVTRMVLAGIFIIMLVSALINYDRGDVFDGHSHFRKMLTGMIVCLVLFAGISAVLR